MVKEELVKRSPLRILEKSTHGGLGKGNLGVITARKGVGKTAFLVHLATDQLFQDHHVIHVSFSGKTDHIIDWYEDIFREIARRHSLEGEMFIHDEVVRNRVVMNFNQQGVRVAQVCGSLKSLIDQGHFNADVIVVDGYDFAKAEAGEIAAFKDFAQTQGVEIWFSATLPPDIELAEPAVPEFLAPYNNMVSIVMLLRPVESHLRLELVKDHDYPVSEDPHLRLDQKILLICEDR